MKKNLSLLAFVALVIFTSCNNADVKENLRTDVDSLVYDLGIAQTDDLFRYITKELEVDSALMGEVIKGMKEGVSLDKNNKNREAYYKGVTIGMQIYQMAQEVAKDVYGNDTTKEINPKNLLAGIVAGLKHKKGIKKPEEAYHDYYKNLPRIKSRYSDIEFNDNTEVVAEVDELVEEIDSCIDTLACDVEGHYGY